MFLELVELVLLLSLIVWAFSNGHWIIGILIILWGLS